MATKGIRKTREQLCSALVEELKTAILSGQRDGLRVGDPAPSGNSLNATASREIKRAAIRELEDLGFIVRADGRRVISDPRLSDMHQPFSRLGPSHDIAELLRAFGAMTGIACHLAREKGNAAAHMEIHKAYALRLMEGALNVDVPPDMHLTRIFQFFEQFDELSGCSILARLLRRFRNLLHAQCAQDLQSAIATDDRRHEMEQLLFGLQDRVYARPRGAWAAALEPLDNLETDDLISWANVVASEFLMMIDGARQTPLRTRLASLARRPLRTATKRDQEARNNRAAHVVSEIVERVSFAAPGYLAGAPIPSRQDLRAEFKVSASTAAKILETLEAGGWIVYRDGVARFGRDLDIPSSDFFRLASCETDMETLLLCLAHSYREIAQGAAHVVQSMNIWETTVLERHLIVLQISLNRNRDQSCHLQPQQRLGRALTDTPGAEQLSGLAFWHKVAAFLTRLESFQPNAYVREMAVHLRGHLLHLHSDELDRVCSQPSVQAILLSTCRDIHRAVVGRNAKAGGHAALRLFEVVSSEIGR